MLRLFSDAKARDAIEIQNAWIATVSERYGVPVAVIKAILFSEMTQIDALDPLADLAVRTGLAGKKDSSTGYAQIFGYVGLNAVNYAVDCGLTTYESLGVETDHRLDPSDDADVRLMWNLLHGNKKANIEVATLNLLVAADEMVGRRDITDFTPDELKLVFTRYNANVRNVTPYGERTYRYYEAYRDGVAPVSEA